MKKFLLFLLGVFMALPAIARDFTYEYEGQTLTYTVIDEDARTCKTRDGELIINRQNRPGNRVSGDLVIPEKAGEYTVVQIGILAFTYCNELTSVVIPQSVSEIAACAFEECSALTSVNIPDNIQRIGTTAFYGCGSLTSVNIPDGVPAIWKGAFSGCGLTSVKIPESVQEIESEAFSGCASLTSVEIPSSVYYIGESAFSGCSSLTSVKIPASLTVLSPSIFSGCRSLTSIEIPSSVTSIQESAFLNCSSLTSIEFPASVTEIGERAFAECNALTWLIIPENITLIGNEAFACSNLYSVMFLPRNCKIGSNVFRHYGGPYQTHYPAKAATYDSSLFKTTFYSVPSQWTIEEDETVDAEKGIIWTPGNTQCWLSGKYTGSVIMPDGMTELWSTFLGGCMNLTDVQLSGTLEKICSKSFEYTGLKEVVIPNRVTQVEEDAFDGVDLVKGAYPNAFENPFDESVVAIEYDAVDSKITDNFVYSRRGDKLHYAPLSITPEFEIPETVTEITDKAFYKCEALTKITLPEKLSTLGNSVWEDCTNLTAIVCNNPEPVVAERDAFHVNVYKDATLYVPKGSKAKYESTTPWSYFYNISDEGAGDGDDDDDNKDGDDDNKDGDDDDDKVGINDITQDAADAIDCTLPVEVYNLQGVMVADSVDSLPAGLYIVRQGKNVKKVAVK